ncbi:NINE protein [Corynebacterium sp. zg254]|uniref:TM2 domain-containing protein n=1 Tax=Corynebacterium sp. zg254 TaxID=2656645 RepID=UPI0021518337|nr:TM2 domain-containing protein [Corynebacterium sp. zg254]MCR5914670.1 NINE protein [Corynebacterium sp. zg254]
MTIAGRPENPYSSGYHHSNNAQPQPQAFPGNQPQSVDPLRLQKAQMEYDDRKKNPLVMWLLWLFLGTVGAHRYYLGNIVYAVFMTLTLGGFGLWTLIDAFFIAFEMRRKNRAIRAEIFAANGLTSF